MYWCRCYRWWWCLCWRRRQCRRWGWCRTRHWSGNNHAVGISSRPAFQPIFTGAESAAILSRGEEPVGNSRIDAGKSLIGRTWVYFSTGRTPLPSVEVNSEPRVMLTIGAFAESEPEMTTLFLAGLLPPPTVTPYVSESV